MTGGAAAECWDRLRWSHDDWSVRSRGDADRTVQTIAVSCAGQELSAVSRLVNMIDEDIYSNGTDGVHFAHDATPAARAANCELQDGRTPADALRTAIAESTSLTEVLVAMIEVQLSGNHAWKVAGEDE